MVIMGRGVFALILFVTKKFDNIKWNQKRKTGRGVERNFRVSHCRGFEGSASSQNFKFKGHHHCKYRILCSAYKPCSTCNKSTEKYVMLSSRVNRFLPDFDTMFFSSGNRRYVQLGMCWVPTDCQAKYGWIKTVQPTLVISMLIGQMDPYLWIELLCFACSSRLGLSW